MRKLRNSVFSLLSFNGDSSPTAGEILSTGALVIGPGPGSTSRQAPRPIRLLTGFDAAYGATFSQTALSSTTSTIGGSLFYSIDEVGMSVYSTAAYRDSWSQMNDNNITILVGAAGQGAVVIPEPATLLLLGLGGLMLRKRRQA